jgi:uncharacterized protein YneF (UPF0154 family)
MSKRIVFGLIAVLVIILSGLVLTGQFTGKKQAENKTEQNHQINSQIIRYLFASYNTDFQTFSGKEGFPYLTEDAKKVKTANLDEDIKLVKEQKLGNQISNIKIHEISFGQQQGEAAAKVTFDIKQLKDGVEQAKATVMDQLKLRWQKGQWLIDDEVGQAQNE